MELIYINLISLFCLLGFLVSNYIYQTKRKNKKVICPNKTKCDRVIYSSYSKIFGFHVETMGMFYYLFMGLIFGFIYSFNLNVDAIGLFLFGLSASALVFSIYLISIQFFIIKKMCVWCLSSATITFIIFLLTYLYIF